MPIIGSLFQEYGETTGQDPFTHQNKKLLKVHMRLRAHHRPSGFDGGLPGRRPVPEHGIRRAQQDDQVEADR